jgi:hypothetical protein
MLWCACNQSTRPASAWDDPFGQDGTWKKEQVGEGAGLFPPWPPLAKGGLGLNPAPLILSLSKDT